MPEPNHNPPATVPEQPEASAPINKRQPLLLLLFIILLVFVVSSVVTATKKATPLKSQLTARPGNKRRLPRCSLQSRVRIHPAPKHRALPR
jgi:hypothetical protein